MKIVAKIAKWIGITFIAACAVAAIVSLMPIGGWRALDVLTGSMKPTIQPGDLAIIHRVRLRDIQPGDIVTYTNPLNPKQTITHRVVSKPFQDGLQMVITKGDANPTADPAFAGGHIVGRVAMAVPFAGRILNWLHTVYGLAALVLIPGLIVIWAEIRILRRALAQPERREIVVAITPPDAVAQPITPTQIRAVRPKRTARRVDSMGPRTLAVLLVVIALAARAGYTHARTTTNVVSAHSTVIVETHKQGHDDDDQGQDDDQNHDGHHDGGNDGNERD